ncbi:MAG: phenylacetate--CoA ligase family protein [Dehalococcoidia bacterium]
MSGLSLLAPVSIGQRDALRATLLGAARLPVYAELFSRSGIEESLIRAEPMRALARLPLFAGEMQARLTREALEQRRFDLGGVELSSGTGGTPKRRVLSEEDLALDAALLTRLLHLAGVRAGDRVTAIELSVTPLAVAFLEGCERLGVRESTALAWRPGADLSSLHRLAPSVLIAPPSLLKLIAPLPSGLPLVIYNGDRLDGETAARLRGAGIGVRSLYGLTETSALGISCATECGVHLSPEQALFELRSLDADHELIVTTLGYSMPLLRYPTGDRVRPVVGACSCGSSWPRVEVLGRLGARFSLFEIELSVDELAAYLGLGDASLQVVLDDGLGGRVRMTLRPGTESRDRWRAMRRRLATHPLLDYLVAARLIQVQFRPLESAVGRKLTPLVDRRGRAADAG